MSTAQLAELAAPLAYSRWERFVDRRRGRQSGRRRAPGYRNLIAHLDGGAPITAPHHEKLSRQCLVRMHDELLDFEKRVAVTGQRVVRLRHDLVAAELSLKRGAVALAAAKAPLTEDELRPRNPTELTLDGEALLNRRTTMRAHRIAVAAAEYERRIAVIDSLQAAIGDARQEIEREFRVAQARVARLREHYALRAATFWEAVSLTHPEGRQFAVLLPRIRQELPAWVGRSAGDIATELSRLTQITTAGTGDGQEGEDREAAA
ncbi:hypothetical protein AB0M91_04190 [Micromonospora rifamycinica]|uniref:hypothetical protein n=1 Tax=Micromonospora rifamycinica TaxID=291594 RepID=UPI0033F6CA1D